MHELSIAVNIIEIAEETALANNASTIEAVVLEIGEMSGVITDALRMSLDISVKGTMLENAVITIHEVAGEARCRQCGNIFPVHDLYTPCVSCGSYDNEITRGKEMKIKSLTFESET